MNFQSIPPLSLLPGSRLTAVTKLDYDWLFDFTGGVGMIAESHWRLIDDRTVILTDEDHGQLFGLEQPVDAAAVAHDELDGAEVSRAELSQASDLRILFANGFTLEVLISSAGYENWHVYGPNGAHTFAIGGGELCREVR